MNRHKWYVAMSAMIVAFMVCVNPVRGDPCPDCCVDDPPACCCPNDNCSDCGLSTCQDCDVRLQVVGQSCGTPEPCCRGQHDCAMMAPDCCVALGYQVVASCRWCDWDPWQPSGDRDEADEPSADNAGSGSVWLLVAAALLLLPAVPIVMRRRAARHR